MHEAMSTTPAMETSRGGYAAGAWRRIGAAGLYGYGIVAVAMVSVVMTTGTSGQEPARGRPGFRELAPGVLTVIPPRASNDSHSIRGDLLEVTKGLGDIAWKPQQAPANATFVERARNREFERGIWCLEFAFKPPRIIDVDVPTTELRMQRKRVWYLVYRVRNVPATDGDSASGRKTTIDPEDPTRRKVETFDGPIRFLPHFVLESTEGLAEHEGETAYRAYLDRVVPTAMDPIRRRERLPGDLYDSASMAAADIAPGEERWGVAIWQDIDPRIDFFTITVRGLTNAIRWRERPGAQFRGDGTPGSEMEHALESLQLDFWRPGDDRDEVEEEMSVGYAGMFERMTLGGKLVESLARTRAVNSRPVAGFADLGIDWSDLLAAAGKQAVPAGMQLEPLAKVVQAVDAVPDPAARGRLVRAVFGDGGGENFERLARALVGPADADRDAVRRQALATLELTPEKAEQAPLDTLARVIESLASLPPGPDRRARSEAFFGVEAWRLERLAKEVAAARTVAALEAVDIDRQRLAGSDGLGAFALIRPAVEAEPDPERRRTLLAALFGPRGPALYAEATEVTEGIDHQWVFRYEREVE
jgi:hypothetical protein